MLQQVWPSQRWHKFLLQLRSTARPCSAPTPPPPPAGMATPDASRHEEKRRERHHGRAPATPRSSCHANSRTSCRGEGRCASTKRDQWMESCVTWICGGMRGTRLAARPTGKKKQAEAVSPRGPGRLTLKYREGIPQRAIVERVAHATAAQQVRQPTGADQRREEKWESTTCARRHTSSTPPPRTAPPSSWPSGSRSS